MGTSLQELLLQPSVLMLGGHQASVASGAIGGAGEVGEQNEQIPLCAHPILEVAKQNFAELILFFYFHLHQTPFETLIQPLK